jgi:hypothetical protein
MKRRSTVHSLRLAEAEERLLLALRRHRPGKLSLRRLAETAIHDCWSKLPPARQVELLSLVEGSQQAPMVSVIHEGVIHEGVIQAETKEVPSVMSTEEADRRAEEFFDAVDNERPTSYGPKVTR